MLSQAQLLAAVFVFERENGRLLTEGEVEAIRVAGIADTSVDLLAEDVWRTVRAPVEAESRCAGYFALGKLGRSSDRERFITALRSEMDRDDRAMFQVMIALDNLGEVVFSGSGASIADPSRNRRDAVSFLEKTG